MVVIMKHDEKYFNKINNTQAHKIRYYYGWHNGSRNMILLNVYFIVVIV